MKYVIEKEHIVNNLQILKKHCGQSEIIGVVKADGYGTGITALSELLIDNGIKCLAVARSEEAVQLRSNDVQADILLLSPPSDAGSADWLCENDIINSVDSFETAALLHASAVKLQKKARAHIVIDTGFGRYGFLPGEENKIIEAYNSFSEMISFEGIYTHFYNAFANDTSSVKMQAAQFDIVTKALENCGICRLLKHACNSSAAVRFPEYHFDAVRVGSALLGRVTGRSLSGIKAVGRLESNIVSLKELPAGHNLGYSGVFTTKRKTICAVVPVGVFDGYGLKRNNVAFTVKERFAQILRSVRHIGDSQQLSVDVNGFTCKVIGSVGLTDFFVDVTDLKDVHVGDVVSFDVSPIYVDSSVCREFI